MKTIKQVSVAAALFFAAISANAVERPKLNFVPVKAGQAVVSVNNENAAYFELTITSGKGEVVYYKQTTEPQKDYNKIYDFKNLAEGNYELSLKVNNTRVTNDFEVTASGIRVGEKKMSYDPYFKYAGNELKLSYLNFDQENMTLSIYNYNGLVYEKPLGKDFNVIKGFDLSKLDKGSYTVVLTSNDSEFSYDIVK